MAGVMVGVMAGVMVGPGIFFEGGWEQYAGLGGGVEWFFGIFLGRGGEGSGCLWVSRVVRVTPPGF